MCLDGAALLEYRLGVVQHSFTTQTRTPTKLALTMPKQIRPSKPKALYDHNARNLVSRQLNISQGTNGASSSGGSSYKSYYSYQSSPVEMKPLTQAHGAADAVDTEPLNEPELSNSETDAGMDSDATSNGMDIDSMDTNCDDTGVVDEDPPSLEDAVDADQLPKLKEQFYTSSVSLL